MASLVSLGPLACVGCGRIIRSCLARFGSLRCHTCRDTTAIVAGTDALPRLRLTNVEPPPKRQSSERVADTGGTGNSGSPSETNSPHTNEAPPAYLPWHDWFLGVFGRRGA